MKFFNRRNFLISLIGGIASLGSLKWILKRKEEMKELKFILNPKHRHWVGDGFYVYPSIRPERETYYYTNPYILMDYAAPKDFPPSEHKRGVGSHPHRGFETVTFAIQGEVEHKDSSGGGGVIKVGDAQWMTAAGGIIHNEYFSKDFTKRGGTFEMVQLWINLPKKNKMDPAGYQEVKGETMPKVNEEGRVIKVVSGEYQGRKGPGRSFTPMNILDIEFNDDQEFTYHTKKGWTLTILTLTGSTEYAGKTATNGHTMVFDREEGDVSLIVKKGTRILVLNAEPIDEPMVAHGPFVMNTREEIYQAIDDYQSGRMGPFEV